MAVLVVGSPVLFPLHPPPAGQAHGAPEAPEDQPRGAHRDPEEDHRRALRPLGRRARPDQCERGVLRVQPVHGLRGL